MPDFDQNLPASWQTCATNYLHVPTGMTLPEAFTAAYAGIYWQECVDSQGAIDARFSSDQNSAAEISYFTQAASVVLASNVLFRAILGGYDSGTTRKFAPLQHPYLPNMWAKDIVSIIPISPLQARAAGTVNIPQKIEQYAAYKVTVSYENLPYSVCRRVGDPGWVCETFRTSNSRVNSMFNGYALDTGAGAGPYIPVKLGVQYVRPEGFYRRKYYRVPIDYIPDITAACFARQGHVNNATVGSYAAGTLLLDSFIHEPYWSDWNGTLNTNVILNFLYVGWGWNNQPYPADPTTLLPLVSQSDHVTKPFPLTDFSVFDSILCPPDSIELCSNLV